MNKSILLGALLGAAVSNAQAFTLNLEFPQGTPDTIDFAYAVSSGDCSSSTPKCNYTHATYNGIKGSLIHKFMRDMNSSFELITAVKDKVNSPTNFVQIKITDQKGLCRINLLGKKNIYVKINKDGNCMV